jgi:acyl-CoA reductase-like NAD-dependent aldehyde dehydrogenase
MPLTLAPSSVVSRGRELRVPAGGAVIGGRVVESSTGDVRAVREAATGAILAHVAECGPLDVDLAVGAAQEAFRAQWQRRDHGERASMMHAIADGIVARAEELAYLESANTGKPIRDTLGGEITGAAEYFRFYAEPSLLLGSDVIPTSGELLSYTRREPYGVVGLVVPWNYPLWNAAMQVAPALAAGNCVILKPAELTPLTALALAEICAEAGLPPGVLNVVPGAGTIVGRAIVEHPAIGTVAFTGSAHAGQDVLARAATPRRGRGGAHRRRPVGPRQPARMRHLARAGHANLQAPQDGPSVRRSGERGWERRHRGLCRRTLPATGDRHGSSSGRSDRTG